MPEKFKMGEYIEMKRFTGLALCLILAFGLVACASGNEKSGKDTTFEAQIVDIDGDTLIVEPAEGSKELQSANAISLSKDGYTGEEELEIGMKVEITYNGEILETYPAQLGEVTKISVAE